MENGKKIIGYCGVDSGQLFVIDPCYLDQWKAGDFEIGKEHAEDGNHYHEACIATTRDDGGGKVLVSNVNGYGVAFSTGYGDGNYPVEAHYKDGRVQKIVIKFF